MNRHKLAFSLIGIFIVQLSYAGYFKHIGREEGLSQSSVMAIYQDKLGRMWFGTREGVNIYNSNKMAVYKAWIQNGNRPNQKILIGNEVSAITGSQNGDVFLIVDHALLKYDIRKETFERLRQGSVYALTSHAGEIWCAGHDSIFRYNPQNNQLDFQLKTGISSINYLTINGNRFYIGAKEGLYTTENKGRVQCLIPKVDVYRIFQSSCQELWVGCRTQGLYRINRNGRINRIPYDPSSPNGISSEQIREFVEDQQGNIWFGTFDGLQKYDPSTQTYSLIKQEQRPGGLSHSSIFSLSHAGEIWCAGHDSIFRYNPQNNQLDFQLKTGISSINYLTINGNRFYIGAKEGLYTTENKGRVQCLIPKVDVYRIFQSSCQELWVGCRTQGLYRINRNGRINRIPYDPSSPNGISSEQIREFVEDQQGNIWFGTFDGLQKYDPSTQTYSLIKQEQRPGGLSHSSIFSLYQDVQGTIWIGSYYGGVNYFNPDNNAFNYYTYNPDRSDCLNYPFAGAMTEDKDHHLWICTDGGGLACLDRQAGHFTTYTAGGPNSLPHNNLKSICYDPKRDCLYIGTHMGGLSRFDRKTGRFYNYLNHSTKGLKEPNDVIFQVSFYNDQLIVSARNGVFSMNPDTNEFRLLYDGYYYQTFTIDPKGFLWLSAGTNLYSINLKHPEEVKSFSLPASIGQFGISKILKGNNQYLYIATLGSGLFCYNEQTQTCINYTPEQNQLLSNYCYNLLQTSTDNILITSDRGITLFNPTTESFRSIELDNGLSLSSIINGCGVWMCSDHTIFIGGTGGLSSFLEKDLNKEYPKPKLYFSSLSVNNARISPDDKSRILTEGLPFVREINLNATQNNLTIEFASSNYVDILNNTWYEYQLEGFDKQWSLTSQTSLKYTNLDPGDYVLHVRQKGNSLKMRKAQEILLQIHINTPWYLTWWAWLSYITISISVTYFIWREKSSRRTLAILRQNLFSLTYHQILFNPAI